MEGSREVLTDSMKKGRMMESNGAVFIKITPVDRRLAHTRPVPRTLREIGRSRPEFGEIENPAVTVRGRGCSATNSSIRIPIDSLGKE